MPNEIERKWLLKRVPEGIIPYKSVDIRQGYLFVKDGELRIRDESGKYFLTIKGDGTLSRKEWESEIDDWVFNLLWSKTINCRISKTRSFILDLESNNQVLELDIYTDNLRGLVVLECEFDDNEMAGKYTLPDYLESIATEVTSDNGYKNKNLAMNGIPT
jgi:CYTH domain-containing protein